MTLCLSDREEMWLVTGDKGKDRQIYEPGQGVGWRHDYPNMSVLGRRNEENRRENPNHKRQERFIFRKEEIRTFLEYSKITFVIILLFITDCSYCTDSLTGMDEEMDRERVVDE